MKEHPILFSGPMIRALLDGRKTQTRRMVMPMRGLQSKWLTVESINKSPRLYMCYTNPDRRFGAQMEHPRGGPLGWVECPYGEPGDRLWVRETCRAEELPDGLDGVRYAADKGFVPIVDTQEATDRWIDLNAYRGQKGSVVPAIHMPRWASRITLEVTGVRVERLNDITDADAEAEGWPGFTDDNGMDSMAWYSDLWDSLNAARGYEWDVNPWVWVMEFRRI